MKRNRLILLVRGYDMKNGKMPDPDSVHPIPGYDKEIYVKPVIKSCDTSL